jgi:hypothetical protein
MNQTQYQFISLMLFYHSDEVTKKRKKIRRDSDIDDEGSVMSDICPECEQDTEEELIQCSGALSSK